MTPKNKKTVVADTMPVSTVETPNNPTFDNIPVNGNAVVTSETTGTTEIVQSPTTAETPTTKQRGGRKALTPEQKASRDEMNNKIRTRANEIAKANFADGSFTEFDSCLEAAKAELRPARVKKERTPEASAMRYFQAKIFAALQKFPVLSDIEQLNSILLEAAKTPKPGKNKKTS